MRETSKEQIGIDFEAEPEMVKRTSELKVYEQQLKKKQRTELCAGLMDKIFDIADEAFNHMQNLDSKEIDTRNWDNWMTLFVKDKQIAGTLDELLAADQSTVADSTANCQLDGTELEDYLQNHGEWPATIITENKPNLHEVLNPPQEAAPTGKGAPKKAAAAAEVHMDEADLVLADEAENNFLLGDVVEQLIKLNFEERAKLKHPQTPNWLTLKLSLVGYPFSGTHTQAKYLKEKFGLDLFQMETLINEAIECPAEGNQPILEASPEEEEGGDATIPVSENGEAKEDEPAQEADGSPKASSEKKSHHSEPAVDSDLEGLSEDESTARDCQEELRQCGIAIRELLLDGQEISDELYVRLFVNKLRMTYGYKSPVEKRKEIKVEAERLVEINARLGEIFAELNKEDIKEKTTRKL